MSLWLAILAMLVSGGVGVLAGRLTKRFPPPEPPAAPDPSLVSWSLPPDLLVRAKALTGEVDAADASGEYKRHQVYAKLIKEFPSTPRRALSKAIEAVLVGLLVLWAVPAAAQAPIRNPQIVAIGISPDHAAVTKYELGWFLAGATDPVQVADLGTGAPNAANEIERPLPSYPVGVTYIAKARAFAGAVVSDWSTPSDPFFRAPAAPSVVIR